LALVFALPLWPFDATLVVVCAGVDMAVRSGVGVIVIVGVGVIVVPGGLAV